MKKNSTPPFNTQRNPVSFPAANILQIDQMQCLNLRGRHISCTLCAEICPATALELTADVVHLDADRCTGCGACLPVCPSGAMWLSEFDPRQFLESVAGKIEIHIHCCRSDDPDAGSVVPCLQVLDARLLAAIAAEGTQTVILHDSGHCSNCVRGDARVTVEQMQVDLDKWFTGGIVLLMHEARTQAEAEGRLAEEQVQLSRRNFLRFAGAHAAHSASRWLDDTTPEQREAAPRWPLLSSDGSTGRPSAYHALLAERAESLPWRDHRLPWRSRIFSDQCNACLTCTQSCPTGALVSEKTNVTISIWFQLRLCTDCGLCVQLCPESAIACASVASPDALHAPAKRVFHRSLRQCAGCARRFVPAIDSDEQCTNCHNEQDVLNDWKAILNETS